MSRGDAERLFGPELVAEAVNDLNRERADDATIHAFAALAREYRGADLAAFGCVVGAWLATMPRPQQLAIVRTVVRGVAGELEDMER